MFQKPQYFFLFLVLSWAVTMSLSACSVCGCGDPLQSIGTSNPISGALRFGFEASYLSASAQSDDNPTQTESLVQKTLQTTLSYSPTRDLTLVALLPLVEKDWNLSAGDDEAASASPSGFGDLNLGLRYFLVEDVDFQERTSFNIALSAGSLFPTGSENGLDSNGNRFDQHAQLGTGAWGPYGGIMASFLTMDWTLSANFNALFHTTNPYQYHYGTALTWGLEAQVQPQEHYALSLAVEGRTADRDNSLGADLVNTGGTVVDLTPGFAFKADDRWGLYSRVQIPILSGLSGIQSLGATGLFGTQIFLN